MKNFNTVPYFDDFNPETNKYYKILFKPGFAVQARELTQLQSQLQDQITKFGNHILQNGSVVLGGARFYENDLLSIKVESLYSGVSLNANNFVGKTIVNSSGVQAIVKAVTPYVSPAEPITFIVKVISGQDFVAGEDISYTIETNSGIVTEYATIQNTDPFGQAVMYSIDSSIFYINGYFVHSESQSIVVSKYIKEISKNIGFEVVESFIDSNLDESLLDNAQGTPNFAAPGADRYQIELVLTSKDLNTEIDNFIEISRVVNGELVFNKDVTLYSELEKEFARRTYDESGDYTVTTWPLSFNDHISDARARAVVSSGVITQINILNPGQGYSSVPDITISGDGTGATAVAVIDTVPSSATFGQILAINITNGGTGYTQSKTFVTISGDENKFTATLDAGKGYVKGYEFATSSQSHLTLNRARSTQQADNLDISVFYGNFIYVENIFNTFNVNTYQEVELHSVVRGSVSGATTQLGTAKVRMLKYTSGVVGSSTATYRMSLFDINILPGKLFKDLESVVIRSGATVTSGANLSLLSKIGGNVSGDAFLAGTDSSALVFPLNHSFVRDLKDAGNNNQTDFSFQRVFSGVNFSSGQASINTANGFERFIGGTGAYNDILKASYYHVVVTAVGTSSYSVGDVLSFASGLGRSITGGTIINNTTHQVTFNVDTSVSFTASIIATINANTYPERIKTLQGYTYKIISSPATTIGGKNSLEVSDINNLVAVYNTGNTDPTGQVTVNPTTGAVTWGSVTGTNVTRNYTLDNGQRDDYYDHGAIVLSGTAPANTNYVVAVFNYFTHTGNGYLSVDSYSSLPYEEIPSYTSPTTGTIFNLRDSIDFRPRRADSGTALQNGQLPDPDIQLSLDYKYYVGRIDKIIATSDKRFIVKTGIPSLQPTPPVDEVNGMNLYLIEVPPYTESLADISVKYVDNRRYTMRDIGKLERRIENIEYYTQLSLLEKQAAEDKIVDATNTEKFKNGFFVDTFSYNESLYNALNPSSWSKQIYGWWNYRNSANTFSKGSARLSTYSVSDSSNIDYKASINPITNELRPQVQTNFLEAGPTVFTSTRKSGPLMTLGYTEDIYLNQVLASKSVNINPYNVVLFSGNIQLNPASDLWVDTNQLPDVNKVVDTQLTDAPDTSFTTRVSKGKLLSVSTNVVTNVVSSVTSSLGNEIVDIQYYPYMRARKVIGICDRFKPASRLYPFLDTDNVSNRVKPLTRLTISNHTGPLFDGKVHEEITFKTGSINGITVGTARVAFYSSPSIADPTIRTLWIYEESGTIPTGASAFVVGEFLNSGNIDVVTTAAFGDSVIPDEFGSVAFEFDIPDGTYKSGARVLRLVDNQENDVDVAQSKGEAIYNSQGYLQTQQEIILTTRELQNQKVTHFSYYDPLAQTFLVSDTNNPQGIYLTSVDIFFKTKSSSIPVTLEIRRTVNGYPESFAAIPFATSTLMPEAVNISDTSLTATNFKLESPIYLPPGEFAIVLLSNSDEYTVYVAEMGKADLVTNQIITQQPYAGSLFKSQNASTWTAIQEEDLKMRIKYANFVSQGSVQFEIDDNDIVSVTGNTTSASDSITNIITTGLKVDDFIYGTGIPANTTIIAVTPNSIQISNNATATGTDVSLSVVPIIKYQEFHVNTSAITPSGTDLTWSMKTPVDSDFFPITQDVDLALIDSRTVAPRANNSGTASVILTANLTTTNNRISPAIDEEGTSVIFIENLINSYDISVTDGEETAVGGPALARYISKKVVLNDGFDASNLVVTLDGYRPFSADIRVYYKVLPVEKSTPFEDESWVAMELLNPVSASTSLEDFREYKFYPPNAFGSYGVPVDDPISPRFGTFAIKIVLASANPAAIPRVENLRAIALDS